MYPFSLFSGGSGGVSFLLFSLFLLPVNIYIYSNTQTTTKVVIKELLIGPIDYWGQGTAGCDTGFWQNRTYNNILYCESFLRLFILECGIPILLLI
jgi:hypothetical protein